MSFGQKLRKLRKKFNMTQKNVADCIHVSRSAIAGYEKKGRQPSHEKLTAIADLFEFPVDYLLNDEEDTITLSPSRLTTNSDDELNQPSINGSYGMEPDIIINRSFRSGFVFRLLALDARRNSFRFHRNAADARFALDITLGNILQITILEFFRAGLQDMGHDAPL